MKNAAGKFIKASPETVSAAGEGAVEMMKGGSLAVDIWNQKGENAYPISAFTYVIVFKDLSYVGSKAEAQALVDFLNWAITDGQEIASAMDYAPLAAPVREKVAAAIGSLTYSGSTLRVASAR